MLHGKKGFDRLVYSCKNVFDKQQTWLFFNVAKSGMYTPARCPDIARI